eukprot:gene60373-82604_t
MLRLSKVEDFRAAEIHVNVAHRISPKPFPVEHGENKGTLGIIMNKQQTKKRTLVFFLVPHFTLLPFSGAIETLRIANRMLGYAAYEWRLAS